MKNIFEKMKQWKTIFEQKIVKMKENEKKNVKK